MNDYRYGEGDRRSTQNAAKKHPRYALLFQGAFLSRVARYASAQIRIRHNAAPSSPSSNICRSWHIRRCRRLEVRWNRESWRRNSAFRLSKATVAKRRTLSEFPANVDIRRAIIRVQITARRAYAKFIGCTIIARLASLLGVSALSIRLHDPAEASASNGSHTSAHILSDPVAIGRAWETKWWC